MELGLYVVGFVQAALFRVVALHPSENRASRRKIINFFLMVGGIRFSKVSVVNRMSWLD
jgi:hypothetical protein